MAVIVIDLVGDSETMTIESPRLNVDECEKRSRQEKRPSDERPLIPEPQLQIIG